MRLSLGVGKLVKRLIGEVVAQIGGANREGRLARCCHVGLGKREGVAILCGGWFF